jgi:8-oxo-dGTP diphosphatase
MSKQLYSCGFLVDESRENVLLIRKNKPEKQKGRLNGVGGKVESGETFRMAMEREFQEEAGMSVDSWKETVLLSGEFYEVQFFWAIGDLSKAVSMTDEKLEIHRIDSIINNRDVLTNLKWIIPVLFDKTIDNLVAIEMVPC